MTGEEVRIKHPNFYKKHKLKDDDFIYLIGDRIRILRKG
jgi:hypothetical protein